MAKLTTTDLTSLANETSAINTINANNALIEAALENTLSRDGTIPNTASADYDMNSNNFLNLADPTIGGNAVNKTYGDANYGGASVIAAAASAAAALVSENAAAANLVLTNADVVSTNADVVLTGIDVAAADASRILAEAAAAIAVSGNVSVSANDTTPSNLEAKIIAGTGISLSTQNDGGNETLTITGTTDPALGFLNKSAWADSAVETITLDTAASAIGKAQVKVWEEIPATGLTNSDWDITTADTGFSVKDSAYAVTLTPAATTGDSIAFTLGSGSWAASDIGKIISNVSAGETGEARIISVAAGVATCVIATAFTDTNAIASGDWKMVAIEFVGGAAELASSTAPFGFGTEVDLISTAAYVFEVSMFSATQAVLVYKDVSTTYIMAVCLTISGTTVSAGTPLIVHAANGSSPAVCVIDSTHAVVVWQKEQGPYGQWGAVLTLSGTTLTKGTEANYSGGINAGPADLSPISSTNVLVAYENNTSNTGMAIVLIITGTTITWGSAITVDSGNTGSDKACVLSSTKAITVHQNHTDAQLQGEVLTITGTSLSAGAELVIHAAASTPWRVVPLTATTALCVYSLNSDYYGRAVVLTQSGTTLTAGTAITFVSSALDSCDAVVISPTSVLVTYCGTGIGANTMDLTISGTTVTAGTETQLTSADTQFICMATYDGTKTLIGYRDVDNSGNLTAAVCSLESSLYAVDQHVATISAVDSVDTTYYTDLNSVTVTETLGGETANYAFSVNPTFTSNVVTGGTFFVIGSGETTTRNIASSLNSVHGGIDGNWYINTNATYASETWAAAAVNEAHAALEEAEATAANAMSGTTVNAVDDAYWPAFGTMFATAIILKTTDSAVTPSVDGIAFNYDGNVINRDETDQYIIEMPATTTIKVTAPSSGGPRNARVYISA
jgi:hypothetical protein